MVERAPYEKRDEQYPLLKVDCGGGDNCGKTQSATAAAAPAWSVTCSSKRSWLVRWPEYISACWMTFILIGISFLVFYGLGMEAYRRQPVLLIKYNGSKPAKEVFYHKIISRGSSVPIMLYYDYLSNMAYQYPYLYFHVYFLVDDSVQSSFRVSGHPRFINTFIPIPLPNTYPLYKMDDSSKRDLVDFQSKFPNINVTILPLSKYMAATPLKYRWRNIPLQYLLFYARVFSVWQNGGVGMDLNIFNNNFNTHSSLDRRISAILKQHNDGIKPEEYTTILNKIDREEDTAYLSLFCGLIHSILNETKTFLTKSFQNPPQLALQQEFNHKNEPLSRTHRNKRDVPSAIFKDNNNTMDSNPVFVDIYNTSNVGDLKKTEYETLVPTDFNINKSSTDEENDTVNLDRIVNLRNFNTSARYEKFNKSVHPQVVLFYDFSVFSDSIPSLPIPESIIRSDANSQLRENKPVRRGNTEALLSLDAEGTFIAASSRLHPFLGRLISAGCQRMHPKFAIQDTILTQCSGILKEDTYCNNIYLL